METFGTVIAAYAVFGLLLCLFLSFRRRKHPKAMMAADMIGMGGTLAFPILMLLWPFFLIVQFIEEKNLAEQTKNEQKESPDHQEFNGCIGLAVTPLMPSGTISIDEDFLDAIAEDGSIEKGEKIRVIGKSMNSLKVRRFQQVDGGQ